jgi:hypothetical protein
VVEENALNLTIFLSATFAAAVITGLVGFAFGLVAAATWLHILSPLQTATLIIAFGLVVQATPCGSCAKPSNGNDCGRFSLALPWACR